MLAKFIRDTRQAGIPFEIWMLKEEGKAILRKLYPEQFPSKQNDIEDDDAHFPFKFSNKWRLAFSKDMDLVDMEVNLQHMKDA